MIDNRFQMLMKHETKNIAFKEEHVEEELSFKEPVKKASLLEETESESILDEISLENRIINWENFLLSYPQNDFNKNSFINPLLNECKHIIILSELSQLNLNHELQDTVIIFVSKKQINLPNYAFVNLRNLKSVQIWIPLQNLPDYCFSGCTSLSSIIFHGEVDSFGMKCFCGCETLQLIEFHQSVHLLGHYCFRGCTSLSSIIFHGEVYLLRVIVLMDVMHSN